ncbi:MAG TPA: serpin family protein [Gemmatimonadales bacterium]|nr:serpin family protein [Gemmatimonadales bacterium]
MRSIVRPLLVAATGALIAKCREAPPGPTAGPPPIVALPRALSAAETDLVAADNRFAFSLFEEIARHSSPDSNLFISPLSAATALAMAYNGAGGTTQTEMQHVLQLDGMTLDDVDRSYQSLIALLRGLDPQVAFAIANSVWYDPDPRYALTPAYLETARTYFDARIQSLDLRSPGAPAIINGWVSDQTRGKIPSIVPDPIPPDVVAYLINAIYFKGSWTTQFEKSLTQPGTFRLANGTPATVPMMTHGHEVRIAMVRGDGVTVFELPYGGAAFTMMVVLPDAGGMDSLVNGLTEQRWSGWVAGLDSASLEVYLPKFTLTYGLGLNDVLRALGMPSAFCTAPSPDFTRMNPSGALCISDVRHKAFVDVNEEGTEAAAATSVQIGFTSVQAPLMVDRPFVFAIRERLSGTILFLGRVMNPVQN